MAKLLLVEDDNNLREIYEARLQAEGYQIVSAKDGEEALVVAKSEKPDLIISDVMMPKISGFEMLDILRNTDELKGVKVIMLTALGQSDDQQRADKLGADRYLVKSQVTLEDIVRTAHELLGDQAEAAGGDAAPAAAEGAPAEGAPAEPAPAAEAPAVPEAEAEAPKTESPATEPAATGPAKPAEEEAEAAASEAAAEPAAQEEADVEAKIEDFVTGATTEPTAPPAAVPDTPAPDSSTDDTPAASTASDDKLMADAVDELVASTDKHEGPARAAEPAAEAKPEAATKPTSIPVSVAIEPDSGVGTAAEPATPAAEETPEAEPAEPATPPESEGSSKKVIKPLDSQPKKDINQLLAEEEAKEAQTLPGATIPAGSAIEEDKPSGAPMAPPSNTEEKPAPADADPADPNSIAL